MNTNLPLQTSPSSLPATPYYLLDEAAIVANMQIIARLCELSGAKACSRSNVLPLGACLMSCSLICMVQPRLH